MHVPSVIRLEEYSDYQECANPRSGCVKVIHNRFDMFGASCNLPNWCGPMVNKSVVGNWLNDYYLCQRHPIPVYHNVHKVSFDMNYRNFFPGYGSLIMHPAKIDSLVLVDDEHKYLKLDNSDLCVNMVQWSDLCMNGKKAGSIRPENHDVLTYSDVPENLFRKFYLRGLGNEIQSIIDATYHMPYGVYSETDGDYDKVLMSFPCANATSVMYLANMTGEYIFAEAGSLRPYLNLKCNSYCYLRRYERQVVSLHPLQIIDVLIQKAYRYLNNQYGVKFTFSSHKLQVCDHTSFDTTRACKKFFMPMTDLVAMKASANTKEVLLNGHLLCGYIQPDNIRMTEAVVYNHTHYIKDFKLKRYTKSYECNVQVEMLTDIMSIITGFTQILNFVMHFVTGIILTLFDFLVSLTFSLEDVVGQTLKAVVHILLLIIDVIIDLMVRSQYFIEVFIVIVSYFLLYNIHRDNWLTFMLLFGTIAAIRVIKSSTLSYDA